MARGFLLGWLSFMLMVAEDLPPPLLPPRPPVEGWRAREQAFDRCYLGWTTGYVRTEFSSRTYDGTSIYTDEPIAAAGWDIPLQSMVEVEDVGVFRVADRGHLRNGQIDVAVWDRARAYEITGWRTICVRSP